MLLPSIFCRSLLQFNHHTRLVFASVIHNHKQIPQRTKSRLIKDPRFPDPRSRSAASRPALKNFIKAPLSQASYRPSPSNLLHTRAVKTHRVRLINLNL